MKHLLELFKAVLGALFACMKALCRQRAKRVVFLSRQSNEPQLDFLMLIDELKCRDADVECICICCRSDKGAAALMRYARAFLYSMYCLATARVAVLNSYWPAVSMLKQRDELTVIQIWHALGKIKQSGWQTIGRSMGHSTAVAQELGMHRGYDVVIGGAKAWNPFYCASFGIEEDKIKNIGLPRLDFLQNERKDVQRRFYAEYPELKGQRIVLYAPTFRPGLREGARRLLDQIADGTHGAVVFKRHPNQPITIDNRRVYRAEGFSSLEMLLVCDCIITDYSAIAVEAASVHVPIYYYCFDIDEYRARNGLNVNPEELMPRCAFRNPSELAQALEQPYPREELERYRATYVLPDADLGKSTAHIVDIIEGAFPA